uniref:Uncharacterized protein n=1 Tax=Arundo donax TaxID=35708 RepID=A0A0A9BY74_ARUDO
MEKSNCYLHCPGSQVQDTAGEILLTAPPEEM